MRDRIVVPAYVVFRRLKRQDERSRTGGYIEVKSYALSICLHKLGNTRHVFSNSYTSIY